MNVHLHSVPSLGRKNIQFYVWVCRHSFKAGYLARIFEYLVVFEHLDIYSFSKPYMQQINLYTLCKFRNKNYKLYRLWNWRSLKKIPLTCESNPQEQCSESIIKSNLIWSRTKEEKTILIYKHAYTQIHIYITHAWLHTSNGHMQTNNYQIIHLHARM